MNTNFIYTILFSLLVIFRTNAQQNLILNGGFEQHGGQSCLECNTLYGQYPALVHHWDNGGWACWLCDKGYKQTADEKKWNSCPLDRISPRDGQAMIEMLYFPTKCINKEYGYATHLTGRTTQTLEVGHLYEISCWLYIDSIPKTDPEWTSHISIALLPQKIRVVTVTGTREIPCINIDTVIYNKWYQAKWRVRPLCKSNYLMIGVFGSNRWPVSQSYKQARYYIDEVSLIEIPSKSAVGDSSIYYCSQYDPTTNPNLKPRMDNLSLRFETNSFELTALHKAALDSLALFAQKYPGETFEISGHTDSIGSENIILSQNRAQSVLQYLRDTKNLSDFRFITLSLGSARPAVPNSTEKGRTQNRRVEIRQSSELDLSMLFYRRALQATNEQRYPEVFSSLNKWLQKNGQGSGIIMLFDPRFTPLKKDKRWVALEKKVRDSYRNLKYPNYAFFIDSLRMEDRKATGELSVLLNDCTGNIPELDSIPFYLPPLAQAEIGQKLKEHFFALSPILELVGFPKKSEFGGSASAAFFLLQHSLDSATYVKWLPILRKTCDEGEASWMAYAMLYDRCQIIADKPQRYATHVERLPNGTIKVLPWEGDENSINEYRARIGLELLSDDVVSALQKNE